MDPLKISRRDRLQRISNVAQNIQLICSPQHTIHRGPAHSSPIANPRSSTTLPPSFQPYSIPLAKSILPTLQEMGLPTSLAQQVSDAYLKASNDLRNVCEASLRSALQDASDKGLVAADEFRSMNKIWTAVHAQQTALWAESAISRARDVVAKSRFSSANRKKTLFNHEYTPLLEKYFEYNAYPSAPDRDILARKSMMTSRQIEVWFQNHRNRARKDGKPLRNMKSDPLPIELSLESLEQAMPLFTVPPSERQAPARDTTPEQTTLEVNDRPVDLNVAQQDKAANALNPEAPPHAFPTIFPPSCGYTPFPTNAGKFVFPAPVWSRRPTTSSRPHSDVDVDVLISDFATKLVLRDALPLPIRRKGTPVGSTTKSSWFAATHTTPCPAPHPAFIRSLPNAKPISLPTIPAIAAPPSRLHPFRSPTPSSQPTILESAFDVGVAHRRVARLPMRAPKHTSVAHRETSPVTSEASPSTSSRSLSSSSRASSFSSDGPFLRRPSSSSSNSSTASSTLATPIFSPTLLPESAPSPISISGIDFQNTDGPFGDSLNTMSPLEGLNLNYPSHANFNIPTIPGKDIFQFGFETPMAHLG